MKTTILQYRKSPIAYAPDETAKCINKYSNDYYSFADNKLHDDVDIIHFHNRFEHTNQKQLIQYHSEAFKVMLDYSYKKFVIPQYPATFSELSNIPYIRNVIDFETQLYNYKEINKIKIGYSPSIKARINEWYDKGYEQTIEILNKIQKKHNIEIDIIFKAPLDECIKRKNDCNIIIDECVTNSYHRSGLEGLALGKLTIDSMSSVINDMLNNVAKSKSNPFHNIWIDDLEKKLDEIIEKGIVYILEEGIKSREWMNKYWHPQDIVNELICIYQNL